MSASSTIEATFDPMLLYYSREIVEKQIKQKCVSKLIENQQKEE